MIKPAPSIFGRTVGVMVGGMSVGYGTGVVVCLASGVASMRLRWVQVGGWVQWSALGPERPSHQRQSAALD